MAQIRTEINLINGSQSSTGTVDFEEKVQLDTTQYNGTVTYYFECVYSGAASNTGTLKLRRGTTDDASIAGATSATVTMSRTSFTPPAGQTEYFARMVGDATRSQTLKAARIVIIQNSTTITNAETQIEIGGSRGATTTSTTAVAVTNPKYWKYTAANWDGTLTAYFESTDKAGNTKSGVTVVLQTSTSITAPSWSNVASSSHTNTSLSATRTRSAAITLVDGNWYRVAYSTGTSKSAATIYNAKIIIDQADILTLDSYSESNQDASSTVASGITYGQGQSFSAGLGGTLAQAKFYLKKTGSPTGNIVATIYAHSGTFGTSSVATGAALATSDNFDVSSLTTSYQLCTFTFSGANQISLSASTNYVVMVERNGTVGDGSNTVDVGRDTSSPSHGGNQVQEATAGSFSAVNTADVVFYILTLEIALTKLEPQYLLANTLFAAGTSLQTFLTNWDSTEWSGVTNTYTFQAEAADNSTSDVVLIDNGGTTVTGSTLTDVDNAQISSAMTMPTSQNLDTKATTNAGDVAGARILVAVVVNAVASIPNKIYSYLQAINRSNTY